MRENSVGLREVDELQDLLSGADLLSWRQDDNEGDAPRAVPHDLQVRGLCAVRYVPNDCRAGNPRLFADLWPASGQWLEGAVGEGEHAEGRCGVEHGGLRRRWAEGRAEGG